MSGFCSSAAKVAPECPHVLRIPHIPKKAMDSSPSPDLLINPPSPPHDPIQPIILSFDNQIRLNPASPLSTASAHDRAISLSLHPTAVDAQQVLQSSASSEAELWPRHIELEDRPSSPSYQLIRDSPKQSERPRPAYLCPKQTELDDCPPCPELEKTQVIREPAYQTEQGNGPTSPPYQNVMKSWMQVTREADYQFSNQAQLKSDEGVDKPKMQMISERAYQASTPDDKLLEMNESYRTSARGRLSRVVEESESFSRREFGANVLNYMSTHSSANHAANLSNYSSYNHSNISYKYPSHQHKIHSDFSYTHSSYQSGTFMNSKSAPAGSAVRTRSAFALFRRGASEGGKLGAGSRVTYRRPRSRKPRSLGGTLLWPLLKIRNGYVGCMMGLEGTGDLSGMAQGGTYATRAQYFADVPLSKTDSRNHG